MTGDQISIEFGALCKPISEQIKNQGIKIPENVALRFDMIAHSIVVLHLHGIIPDSVRDTSRKKLMAKISKEIHK
jgi:hypothetical protein